MPEREEQPFTELHCLLSADARFTPIDFTNDQTWELTTTFIDPPSITLHTTYGLRAHWMRLFPGFSSGNLTLHDPQTFAGQPLLISNSPSVATLTMQPFKTFDVRMEYYVPASNLVCGRIQVTNTGDQLENWRVSLNTILNPIGRGQLMTPVLYGMNTVLQGKTQNVMPVLYVTGGPEPASSPYTALIIPMTLQAGQSRTISWALASLRTLEESFALARQTTGRAWDADLLRMDMEQKKRFYSINTPKPEWDRVFERSQRQSMQLMVTGPNHKPGRTFVLSRKPDHGYSVDGRGNDYLPAWIGQTALDAWYYCRLILPGYIDVAREILESFLSNQHSNGFISNQMPLSDHPSPDHAFPILAETAHMIFSYDEDADWLRSIYPALIRYLRYWFAVRTEGENEELPAWTSSIQSGFDALYGLDAESSHSMTGILPFLISPALLSFLYRECTALLEFVRILDANEDKEWLLAQKQRLAEAVEKCWNDQSKSYRTLDLQAEEVLHPQKISTIKTNGKVSISKELLPPGKLFLQLKPAIPSGHPFTVTLHGRVNGVMVSCKMTGADFKWHPEGGVVVCGTLFECLDVVTVQGLDPGSVLTLSQPDSSRQGISQCLPLWAGIPGRERAAELVTRTILPRCLTEIGLSSLLRARRGAKFPGNARISLMWNLFILDGLSQYGFTREAAEITTALLNRYSKMLAETGSLFPTLVVDSNRPVGDADSLSSLVPPEEWIKQLGVEAWSERGLIIQRTNSYFSPGTVVYNRIKVTFLSNETGIELASGTKHVVTAPPAKRVLFSPGKEKR